MILFKNIKKQLGRHNNSNDPPNPCIPLEPINVDQKGNSLEDGIRDRQIDGNNAPTQSVASPGQTITLVRSNTTANAFGNAIVMRKRLRTIRSFRLDVKSKRYDSVARKWRNKWEKLSDAPPRPRLSVKKTISFGENLTVDDAIDALGISLVSRSLQNQLKRTRESSEQNSQELRCSIETLDHREPDPTNAEANNMIIESIPLTMPLLCEKKEVNADDEDIILAEIKIEKHQSQD